MAKGHLIFGLVMVLTMILVPALSLFGEIPASPPGAVTAEQEGQQPTVQVLRTQNGQTQEYSLTDYLFGVVAAEMPMSYEDEALKAQCVAAYTLYLYKTEEQNTPVISDDSAVHQAFITREVARAKWGEKATEYEQRLDALIGQVLGKAVTYQGAPALTVYHALCAGRTESAQAVWGSKVPYLVPKESVGDLLGEGYISQKTVTKTQFLEGLSLENGVQGEEPVGEITRTESGTVEKAVLFGKEFTGSQIRSAFSLRSANFDLEFSEEQVTFTVRGYGHLVGMSQFGANTMAQQGSDYREILEWYYTGCTVETMKAGG